MHVPRCHSDLQNLASCVVIVATEIDLTQLMAEEPRVRNTVKMDGCRGGGGSAATEEGSRLSRAGHLIHVR